MAVQSGVLAEGSEADVFFAKLVGGVPPQIGWRKTMLISKLGEGTHVQIQLDEAEVEELTELVCIHAYGFDGLYTFPPCGKCPLCKIKKFLDIPHG